MPALVLCAAVLTSCSAPDSVRTFSNRVASSPSRILNLEASSAATKIAVMGSSGAALQVNGRYIGSAPNFEVGTEGSQTITFGGSRFEPVPPLNDGQGAPTVFRLGTGYVWNLDLWAFGADVIDVDARHLPLETLNVYSRRRSALRVRVSSASLVQDATWSGTRWTSITLGGALGSSVAVEVPQRCSVLVQGLDTSRPRGTGWKYVDRGPHGVQGGWALSGPADRWVLIDPSDVVAPSDKVATLPNVVVTRSE